MRRLECGERIIDNIFTRTRIFLYVQFGVHTFLATLYLARDEREQQSFIFAWRKRISTRVIIHGLSDDIRAYIQVYMYLEQYDEVTRILNYFIKKREQDNASSLLSIVCLWKKRIRCAAILQRPGHYLEYTAVF